MEVRHAKFSRTTSPLVIGANGVTNPAARSNPALPIYGMGAGFAGIDNDLYFDDLYFDQKTLMLFGDAKSSVAQITQELKVL